MALVRSSRLSQRHPKLSRIEYLTTDQKVVRSNDAGCMPQQQRLTCQDGHKRDSALGHFSTHFLLHVKRKSERRCPTSCQVVPGDCIPSRQPFVDNKAVRQSTHEREDEYR